MKSTFTFLLLTLTAGAFAGIPVDPLPTPEPASFLMLGSGLTGLAFVAWRRSRKK
jgi:hypothetical protein